MINIYETPENIFFFIKYSISWSLTINNFFYLLCCQVNKVLVNFRGQRIIFCVLMLQHFIFSLLKFFFCEIMINIFFYVNSSLIFLSLSLNNCATLNKYYFIISFWFSFPMTDLNHLNRLHIYISSKDSFFLYSSSIFLGFR